MKRILTPKESETVFRAEEIMEYHKWVKEIPYFKFKPEWEVQVSPPFARAVVRFRVRHNNKEVSVYLDCYDYLGFVGQPYWEVYPYEDDVYRCLMNNTDELLNAIEEALK